MQPLRHGYTNNTVGDGFIVQKTYAGPEARRRHEREHAILTGLRGQLPVPPVCTVDDRTLELGFMAGTHGQDLIEAGRAVEVLRACGTTLRRIHAVDPSIVISGTADEQGPVLVHGDYGPNNVLLDPSTFQTTAILDWEFAHLGEPIEDLAWCEWIIRAHHPEHVGLLPEFYAAYGGPVPPWSARRAVMLAKCRMLEQFCQRWIPDGAGVRQWRERAARTEGWTE